MEIIETELKVLKTKVWLEFVLYRSGESSLYGLQKLFSPNSHYLHLKMLTDEWKKTDKWYQYNHGQRNPSKRLIDEVEKRLPGTEQCLKLVLWDIIARPSWSDLQIKIAFSNLNSMNRYPFFSYKFKYMHSKIKNRLKYDPGLSYLRNEYTIQSLEYLMLIYISCRQYNYNIDLSDLRKSINLSLNTVLSQHPFKSSGEKVKCLLERRLSRLDLN